MGKIEWTPIQNLKGLFLGDLQEMDYDLFYGISMGDFQWENINERPYKFL